MRAVSNGCARLVNAHIMDLYNRVPVGSKVTLLPKT
jgi:lipoprotein-anchoring transpeptidase ErfK/SrfK